VSLVDVPGHERFIKNMLAGVGGIDLALLVVAADEGVMPQTREHLAILDLLRVKRGILVITKRDLVDADWLELVQEEVREAVAGTTLAAAPMLAVSAVTGEGLPDLLKILDALLAETPPKKDVGRPRLPVDRVFTIAGFGAVVTGTLIDGRLTLGQEVAIAPSGLRSRVRGLQTHRKKVEVAVPGTRVAANLAGLSTDELRRGDVVTLGGWLRPADAADVRLRLTADAHPLPHNAPVTVHLLASEAPAVVRLLDRDELLPGESGWAQLKLDSPIPAVRGDFFIIRTGGGTVGGGEIVDPAPKRHRRRDPEVLARLAAMEGGGADDVLAQLLEQREPCDLAALTAVSGLSAAEMREAAERLAESGAIVALGERGAADGALLLSAAGWAKAVARAEDALRAHHKQYPLRLGMSKEEVRSRLRLPGRAGAETLARLITEGRIVEEGTQARLPGHEVAPTPPQQAAADAFLKALAASPYTPPTDLKLDPEIVQMLADQRRIVNVGDGVIYAADAYHEMVQRITEHLRAGGAVNVGAVRDMFGASRKYALALLEHLDQVRVTRRVGDDRVLL
ncbi:MAG: selenocysteine-specific translation elongation factor, partial [Chloroflexi bacterium]|nr:selenocysteine-specific translation elongation factor [Chloroflexota bacterium]